MLHAEAVELGICTCKLQGNKASFSFGEHWTHNVWSYSHGDLTLLLDGSGIVHTLVRRLRLNAGNK
jgi:hypothetical protein